MAQYTTIIDYCLYDYNDKQGKVPFLDGSASRLILADKIRGACGLSNS